MKSTILAFTLDRMMLTCIVFRKGVEADCEHIIMVRRHEWVEKIVPQWSRRSFSCIHGRIGHSCYLVHHIAFIDDSSSLNSSSVFGQSFISSVHLVFSFSLYVGPCFSFKWVIFTSVLQIIFAETIKKFFWRSCLYFPRLMSVSKKNAMKTLRLQALCTNNIN